MRQVACYAFRSYLNYYPDNIFLQRFKAANDTWNKAWNDG